MPEDLLNIVSSDGDPKNIDQQLLLDYLAGKLSAEQRHEVERLMAGNEFYNDAVEGLEEVSQQKDLPFIAEQLNSVLQKRLQQKKQRKEKRKLKDTPWAYLAIILIVILIIVSYLIIHRLNRPLL